MKNLSLKILAILLISFSGYWLQAQQTINYGDTGTYSVDLADGPNGTPGSTYTWTIFDTGIPPTDITNGGTLTITGQGTNEISIDWGTTSPGVYTLNVVETNNNCTGSEITGTVTISALGSPALTATNADICSSDLTTDFEITGAPANSIVTFTITGGTAVSPVTVDASGNGTITATHDGTSPQITVSLTSMELPNGTVINLDPTVNATTNVTIITTSNINFTP